MAWIFDHWKIIVAAIVFVCGGIVALLRFFSLEKEERYKQIRGWLLQAVLIAEKQFGSKTGRLKLSTVYSEFCKQIPWLARVVSYENFSGYVDDALLEMKELLESNSSINSFVEKEN